MFNFVNRYFQHRKFPPVNALDDPVDERDYRLEEIDYGAAMGMGVDWKEKPQSEWRKFPIFNQGRAGSCVGHAVAKLIGIEFHNYTKGEYNIPEYVDVSKRDIYTRRANKPAPGMWFRDGMSIGKDGATLEVLMPTKMTEGEMNRDDDRMKWKDFVANVFAGAEYFATPLDIDAIARVIDRGHGDMIGLRFDVSRYNRAVPLLPLNNQNLAHHAVTVVDRTIWDGKRALIIDDSWGSVGFDGQRVITEDWFHAGLVTASWFYEDLEKLWENESEAPKPKYKFKHDLYLGMQHEDVEMLQECLDWLGMYDLPGVYTGYLGGITLKAVKEFQEHYAEDILGPLGLLQPTGYVGESTRRKLNELFA